MANAQIIFMESQKLAEEGKIAYTGRTFEALNMAGEKVTIRETEDIHTYQVWKDMGYQVQKGQKAVTKITIWKHSGKKMATMTDTDGNEVQYVDKGRMFMKTASFFSRSQVEMVGA